MARKSDVANVKLDVEAGLVAFAFAEACGGDTVTVNPFEFDANVQRFLTLHGANQKLRDSYAGKDGKDARDAFDKVFEALKAGKLTTRGEGEGIVVGASVEAFRRLMIKANRAPADWPIKDAREIWSAKSDEWKKQIRGTGQFIAELAAIAQEKAAKAAPVDVDAMLGEVTVAAA